VSAEGQHQSGAQLEFGPFTLDQALGKLTKRGTPIRLRGMPMKILLHMVEHQGKIVSRKELERLLWEGRAFGDFEQGLNTAVNVVRKMLGDSADQPRYIETIPGQGYRFIAPIRSARRAFETPGSNGSLVSEPAVSDLNEAISNAPEDYTYSVRRKAPGRGARWVAATVIILAALGTGAWWAFRSNGLPVFPGKMLSANREANDQFDLAMQFLVFQNDIPSARKTIERALELDPQFAVARLQRATLLIIEIYNGYANDESILLEAEKELHQAEPNLTADDGLLLATQAAVFLAQGRLDRVPRAGIEEWWQKKGSKGEGSPVWLVIPRMLEGQTGEPLAILRRDLELHPLANPSRMLLGEVLRTQGNTAGAIRTLERAIQQGPRHPVAAWSLAMAYLDDGKPELARALLERMRLEFEKNYVWRHAWAILLAVEGRHKEALEAMDEATLQFARLTWSVTSSTADFYALQGDRSKAIEWLQFAVGRGDERVSYFRRNPRLTGLREEPRFQSLLRSVEARRK
jgi:DNA-binding winged helix-turn-helix (wHTH) protein/Tfp pilus assembly protein PilF